MTDSRLNEPMRNFTLGDITASPGEKAIGYCHISLDGTDYAIPVAVINGSQPGPVLAVTAGIHGGEYVSILAVRAFAQELDANRVQGTIVVVLQSSPPSFYQRSAFVNPVDEQNLNRSFPGRADGNSTEQLAYWIWTNVISRADFYVDCHCGDLPESLQPFTGVAVSEDEAVDARALSLANCWDVVRTIATKTTGSTIWAAAQAGIPAVLVEWGQRGQWTANEVEAQKKGLQAVARRVGLLEDDGSQNTTKPSFEVAAGIDADADGLWFPQVVPGDEVAAGTILGQIEDPFGETLSAVTSPIDGVYVYGLTSLAVHAGDFLAAIVRPRENG